MLLFAFYSGSGIAVPTSIIYPLEYLLHEPTPPYLPHVPPQSESSDSDVPLPDPYAYDADVEWD